MAAKEKNMLLGETAGGTAKIIFEPGFHPTTDQEMQLIRLEIYNGNLDVHLWNEEVGQRIAGYAFQSPALFLAIDGNAPVPNSKNIKINQNSMALDTWISLPARPSKLSQSGEVYVIMGDYQEIDIPLATMANMDQIPQKIIDLDNDETRRELKNVDSMVMAESLARFGTYLGVTGALAVGYKARENRKNKLADENKDSGQTPMTRRKFLEYSGIYGAHFLAMLLALYSPLLNGLAEDRAATAATETQKNHWQQFDEIVNFKFFSSSWLRGRTGLLMSKSEDVREHLSQSFNNAQYSLVMGNGHENGEMDLQSNRTHRFKEIRSLAEGMVAAGKRAYAAYYNVKEEEVPAEAINNLLDFIAQTDVVKVTDPGGPAVQKNLVSRMDEYVIPVDSFLSPQVLEAIKELRP